MFKWFCGNEEYISTTTLKKIIDGLQYPAIRALNEADHILDKEDIPEKERLLQEYRKRFYRGVLETCYNIYTSLGI